MITVLMSTYNGEKYLSEQLDSILRQEKVDLNIVVRDDCSSDRTNDILNEYSSRYENITVIKGKQNLGACGSFFSLVRNYSDSDFFALADQDDVWDKDKLSIALKYLEDMDLSRPALYYSNLRIVNSNLNFIRNSHSTKHTAHNKYACLIENLATGCTIVYNKSLAKISNDVKPFEYSMHDAWLYQVATLFGKTVYDFEPHINYRVHGDNEVGTYLKFLGLKKSKQILKDIFDTKDHAIFKNAKIFYEEFEDRLNLEDKQEILKVINYKDNMNEKIKLLKDKGMLTDSINRNFRFYLKTFLGTL